jgi:hypothetical protein
MANQFWLIGPLTPHMDREILPSNEDVLPRFFFFSKVGKISFFWGLLRSRGRVEAYLAAVSTGYFHKKSYHQEGVEYIEMKERVSSLKVVNDTVEPAIGLMTKHNSNCRTKNEKVLQQNLQVQISNPLWPMLLVLKSTPHCCCISVGRW